LKREGFFKKRERAARVKGQSFSSKNKEEREREESDSLCSFLSRANILFWKKQKRRRNPSLSIFFSLSLRKRRRVKNKKTRLHEEKRKRTPPEIGFASKENLFSYDKAPVNKSAFFL